MAETNLLVLAREFKKLRDEVKNVLQMPKGDKGDQGEKGDKGDKGDIGPQGFPGRDGKDGINGYDGKDGRDGVDGKDGKDGVDGVGVANAYIDFDNSLVIVLTNGNEVNAGYLSQETKDAVIANFKQGAQTISELLPSQEGNAGKFLTTDGTNISWATVSAGGGGTVTSVALTAPTGFAVTGSPVTTTGTLALGFDTGYSLPTTVKQGQWDTAYGWGNHASAGYLDSGDIGVSVQAYDADLTAWAGVSTSAKQDTLVSGTNIKTVNSSSLLGSGDLALFGGGLTKIEKVSSLPGSPDANTLYIVV